MESSNIEDLHTLISKTYQNIFDIAPVLKELSSAARAYHKALQNLSGASSIFHQALAKISRMASSSKGPAQILGETITDIMETHKDIENRRQEITKLMMNDLIIPIESLVESDNVYVKAILKNYNHDNKTKVELVEKARTELLKVRKKSQRKKPTEKYEEKEKQCDEYHNNLKKQLENFRKESCQRSLSEEWKRYVFVVDRSSIFMKTFMDFYDHNAAMLREKLSSWFAQVKKKPQYQDQELNGSIAQEIDPFGPATSKVKIMAIFDHNATEESQLSFKQGDVLDPISEVVSGWQYGQNIKTSKSGWYPAAYTQEIVAVPTGASTSQTLPASGVHTRPPLDQSSGHKSLKRYSSAGPSVIGAIPVPDYGPHEQAPEQNQEPLTPPATPVKNEVPATMTTTTATGPIPARPPSDTLPPPPPPPTPPPEQDNNNDSALSNPFTGIALKKTVTNDRSAPQIP